MAFNFNPPKKKRLFECENDSDSEDETRTQAARHGLANVWIRFLILEGEENPEALSKISPFAIQKWIKGVTSTGIHSVKKLRSGTFLIECEKEEASRRLRDLKDPSIIGVPAKISPHTTLNSSKGVIRCRDIISLTELEIKEELKDQGVIQVQRVSFTEGSKRVPTSTLFLTFVSSTPPKSVKVGYLSVPVSPFVPAPLRCFKCQQFGHSKNNCRKPELCRNCGKAMHDDQQCSERAKCVNCGGEHPASSKTCSAWIRENEIQKVRTEKKCSFAEAKRIVSSRSSATSSSYVNAALGRQGNGASSNNTTNTGVNSKLEERLLSLLESMDERVKKLETILEILVNQIGKLDKETGSPVSATENRDNSSAASPASKSGSEYHGSKETTLAMENGQPQSTGSTCPSNGKNEDTTMTHSKKQSSQPSSQSCQGSTSCTARAHASSALQGSSSQSSNRSRERCLSRSRERSGPKDDRARNRSRSSGTFGSDGFVNPGPKFSSTARGVKFGDFLTPNQFEVLGDKDEGHMEEG